MLGNIAAFAGALRGEGIRAGLGDEIDAARALELLDLLDRAEVHDGLRVAFKVPREAWDTFDRLFDEYWGGAPARRVTSRWSTSRVQGALAWRWDGQRVRLATSDAPDAGADTPSYSPEPVLRRKPFDQLSAREVAALERMIERLLLALPRRMSRRRVPHPRRGTVDLRRSFRRALATDGELLGLAHRERTPDEPRVVLLCDTSGSMQAYTRLLLAFAFALRRRLKRLEIFVFNTALVRVTRMVAPARVTHSLGLLAAGVPDWSGGTRIGACLAEFVAVHRDRMVDRNTTVVLVSDGLDLGEPEQLARAMQALRERAASIVWLNPLLGDARYRPDAAGMRAALPYVDHFAPAHNLEALQGLLRLVA
ncbi:MAG TPA: VWA domain-containing protein [Burkholderiales bacterium]|nr:VWA domain-containing protein [Burkholderiales bacterium]